MTDGSPTDAPAPAEKACGLSPDGVYRYWLTRVWGPGPCIAFIGLNPSRADDTYDDPTLRRMLGFARREGAGGLVVLNLFAYRHMNPRVMKLAADPVGPENDATLRTWAMMATRLVACWGADGGHLGRDRAMAALLGRPLECFGVNQDGSPKHPLYLKAEEPLQVWRPPA